MANDTVGKGNTRVFVKKQIEKGFSKKEIKKALISAGHSEKKVDSILEGIGEINEIPVQKAKTSSHKGVMILLVVSVIVIVAVALVLLRSGESDLVSQETETLIGEEVPAEPEAPPARRGPPSMAEACSERPEQYHEGEIAWLALASGNSSYCDFLEETPRLPEGFSKEQCYIQFNIADALTTKDCTILDRDKEDYNTAFIMCQAAIDKTPNICASFTDIAQKADCSALLAGDIEVCGSAQESIGAACRTNFYYVSAHVESDPSICQNIEDSRIRETCVLKMNSDVAFVMETIRGRCFNEFGSARYSEEE